MKAGVSHIWQDSTSSRVEIKNKFAVPKYGNDKYCLGTTRKWKQDMIHVWANLSDMALTFA